MRDLGIKHLVGFYGATFFVAFAFLIARGHLETLLPEPQLLTWVLHASYGLGVGIVIVGLSRLSTARFAWAMHLADEFRSVLSGVERRGVLIVALTSALAEESLFRGLLQPSLGLWLTAAIFAVLHVGPTPRFLPWTIMAFGAGLLFGGLFDFTGNLLAPFLAHATVNYLNLRYLVPESRRDLHMGTLRGFAGL
ncbi:MAG: CPBP family intramembrane metalloprotease [Clostridia bacterium]|nr:CPBP family intramembrane metalloprotease [Deltaproteobacteria bacterium]